MKNCIQKITVRKRFYVGMVFYHSLFGDVADKHTVVNITKDGKIFTTGNALFHPDYPEQFHPCDAGCFGWQYDDRPCRVGNTEGEALRGGEAYFKHWKATGGGTKGFNADYVSDYW